jgi:hypothetical protein
VKPPEPVAPIELELPGVAQPELALGIDRTVADGFTPHGGENRRARRAAVATWQPPKGAPSRRALLKQRQRRARGVMRKASK